MLNLGEMPSISMSRLRRDYLTGDRRQVVVVLVVSALSLTFLNFGTTNPAWFVSLLEMLGAGGWAERARSAFEGSDSAQLNRLVFWGGGQIMAYTLLPVAAIKLVLRDSLGNYGLRTKGIGSHGGTYAVLLALSVPFVVIASFTPAFQAKYPFYDLAPGEGLWPGMALWWVIYGLQFAALEFFFRGFMVHGLSSRFGYLSVFVMMVPYNMLHYGKPVAEALAAIVGGIILGSLSLRSRSIWWGVGVHVGVAATMDVAALAHKGFLW